MPVSELLSKCPSAVIVAKQKRQVWAEEEAWDLAAIVGGEVVRTVYPGVILIVNADPEDLVEALKPLKMSFISKINIRKQCFLVSNIEKFYKYINNILDSISNEYIDLRLNLRGKSKSVLNKNLVENIIKNKKKINRKSNYMIMIDSIDEVLVVGWGRKSSCGFKCLYVW